MAIPLGFDDASSFMSRIPLTSSSGGSTSALTSLARAARGLGRLPSLLSRMASDGQFYDDPEDGTDVKALLDSKYTAEKVEGMKRLLALMSIGTDVSQFFPQVVKNIGVPSLHVKRMVYMYLAHYAQRRPDEALLSINSLQKEISDPNGLVRAQALRTMSSTRLQTVIPLIVMAVKKCSRDPSPFVRRCAAHSLLQIHAIDRDQHAEILEELVEILLGDASSTVVGPAAAAFLAICPHRLDLVGPKYRSLCQNLREMDEWAQVVVLDLLLRYVSGKHGAPDGSMGAEMKAKTGGQKSFKTGISMDGGLAGKLSQSGIVEKGEKETSEGELSERNWEERWGHARGESSPKDRYEEFFSTEPTENNWVNDTKRNVSDSSQRGSHLSSAENHRPWEASSRGGTRSEQEQRYANQRNRDREEGQRDVFWDQREPLPFVHDDVKLLLKCTTPMLHSRNSAVVMGAAGVKWQLSQKEELKKFAKPLVFLLRSSPDSQYVALTSLSTMAQALPSMFDDLYEEFFIRAIDSPAIRTLKLGILAAIATELSIKPILCELQAYLRDPDRQFVAKTVQTIASCATRLPSIASTCMEELLHLAQAAPDTSYGASLNDTRGLSSQPRGLESASYRRSRGKVEGNGLDKECEVEGCTSNLGSENNIDEERSDALFHHRKLVNKEEKGKRQAGEGQNEVVVKEAMTAIRGLVQQRPAQHKEALARLLRNLNSLRVSEARATTVWLTGEYCGQGETLSRMAPLVMRHMALHFKEEEDITKLQILNSTAKVLLRSKAASDSSAEISMKLLMQYVLDLARYDPSYDIRDRGRMIRQLLAFHDIGKGGQLNGFEMKEGNIDVLNIVEEKGKGLERNPGGVLHGVGGQLKNETDLLADRLTMETEVSCSETRRQETSSLNETHWKQEELSSSNSGNNMNGTKGGESENERQRKLTFLGIAAKKLFFAHKPLPALSSLLPDRSGFYIGSLSHVVNHRAPGYEPFPEPNSVRERERETDTSGEMERIERGRADRHSNVQPSRVDDEDEEEEDWTSESGSFYSSDYSGIEEGETGGPFDHKAGKKSRDDSRERGVEKVHELSNGEDSERRERERGERESKFSSRKVLVDGKGKGLEHDLKPLIDLSEGEVKSSPSEGMERSLIDWDGIQGPSMDNDRNRIDSNLDTWLGSASSSKGIEDISSSEVKNGNWTYLLQSVRGKPKRQKLLDFTSGEGLEVDYSINREQSGDEDKQMIGIRLYFQNRSSETMLNIVVIKTQETGASSEMLSPVTNETSTTVIPSEEIVELGVGQAAEALLYVNCSYQLKPVRLTVTCNGHFFPAKLSLDIGALLEPKAIEDGTFDRLEQQLVGMHETRKRCILSGRLPKGRSFDVKTSDSEFARAAVQKILNVAHLALVSAKADISTLHSWQKWCLRFSGQTVLRAQPCLVTVENEGAVMQQENGDVWRLVLQIKVNCDDAVFGLSFMKAAEEVLKAL